ncbi:MAG: AAA family ATPase [Desulfobacteraceae bacterium]|nr:AAA family ATPase [Desulfobacteraceae bacterium]
MFLEDVHIEGFKSFSEKTRMSFQPGIGVIMGKNGVGKSNILDALVWTLGESDIHRLRCVEDDELFFAGSNGYPPAAKARVEMVIRPANGEDSAGFKLAREKTRAGDERFEIDDTVCSGTEYLQHLATHDLKDALKTIIRQEEINNVLQLDPPQRYEWIESMFASDNPPDAKALVEDEIAPRFHKYMSYLMPRGDFRLFTTSTNGRQALEVEAGLPGNRMRKAHQLSGGEKSVTSLALKLALFAGMESAVYLLDEVEPALDYTHHKSMQTLLKEVAARKQLIMITHLRSTIELADTLHGVRTRFDGSSFMKFYFLMDERLLRLYKCC